MKLLINKELRYIDEEIKDNNDSSYELYNDFFEEMKKYGIFYKEEFNSDGLNVIILEQKVCLDEYQMNNLFVDVLCYFDYNVEVTPLGNDVDFCLEIE